MKSRIIHHISFAFIIAFSGISSLFGQQSRESGDRVLAEWANKAWYEGEIDSPCEGGYQILYDDGDTKCAEPNEIVSDEVPPVSDLEIGTLVLASWSSAFYPAKITGIKGSTFSIVYYDGYEEVRSIDQLRSISGAAAKLNDFVLEVSDTSSDSGSGSTDSTTVVDSDIEIWWSGSRWATIETDGDIWIGGSRVGTFESDGDVWVGSSSAGDVESDGDIWVGSNDIGDIEANGDIWLRGSRIGEIEPDGDIYLGGSWWGEADPFDGSFKSLRAVAAVLAFFAEDFGFTD